MGDGTLNSSIKKYLDCSTMHMAKGDDDRLRLGGGHSVHCYQYEHGYFVIVPRTEMDREKDKWCFEHDLLDMRQEGYSESFLKVVRHAYERDCEIIRFDADGYGIEGLDVHNWD